MKVHSIVNMTVTMRAVALAALVGVSFPATPALAANALTGNEVKKLVAGNTIHFEVAGKGRFKAYLDPAGKVTRKQGDKVIEGKWRVKDDGALCVHYAGNEERCGTVKKNSDGSYTRIDDANTTNHWTKISKGKDL